ncbi:MAG: helix-turn-helix transcriptional regulator [Cyanobacteriota bacterium]|nr:helix-turn-helix transcriptional regulator [Cyanobacteriota bacterium]MDY6363813.1 helix-turn-helix transcriptional regulator [Cyanobacteriota bacterium]MDY6383524.1 helix-turn-helix transcriptional regulator [Cyanobacteriota bacterium]
MQYDKLGKFIKYKRETLGVSLNKFAIEAEIDPAILSRIENLKQGIKLGVLENISSAFGLTLSQFFKEYEKFYNVNKK